MSWKDAQIGVSSPTELLHAVNEVISEGYYVWKVRMNSIELVKDDGQYITDDLTIVMCDGASDNHLDESWNRLYRSFSTQATLTLSYIINDPRNGFVKWERGPEYVEVSIENAKPGDIAEYDIEEEGKTQHRVGVLSVTFRDEDDPERIMGIRDRNLLEGSDENPFLIFGSEPSARVSNMHVWRKEENNG